MSRMRARPVLMLVCCSTLAQCLPGCREERTAQSFSPELMATECLDVVAALETQTIAGPGSIPLDTLSAWPHISAVKPVSVQALRRPEADHVRGICLWWLIIKLNPGEAYVFDYDAESQHWKLRSVFREGRATIVLHSLEAKTDAGSGKPED